METKCLKLSKNTWLYGKPYSMIIEILSKHTDKEYEKVMKTLGKKKGKARALPSLYRKETFYTDRKHILKKVLDKIIRNNLKTREGTIKEKRSDDLDAGKGHPEALPYQDLLDIIDSSLEDVKRNFLETVKKLEEDNDL